MHSIVQGKALTRWSANRAEIFNCNTCIVILHTEQFYPNRPIDNDIPYGYNET